MHWRPGSCRCAEVGGVTHQIVLLSYLEDLLGKHDCECGVDLTLQAYLPLLSGMLKRTRKGATRIFWYAIMARSEVCLIGEWSGGSGRSATAFEGLAFASLYEQASYSHAPV